MSRDTPLETEAAASATARILQVITGERQARDRGWWNQLSEYYHPEARIQTSWFSGSIAEYIDASKKMAVSDPAGHRLGQPAIRVNGGRAVAEVPMTIEFRGEVLGVEADLTVYIRFLHRIERRNEWRLLSSVAIFERDTITPAVPGTPLTIPAGRLAGLRPSYRLLTLWLTERGHAVSQDRYGLDRPEQVQRLYEDEYGWADLATD
ncbi:nuclear transport factor 2 family protein [Streptomyces sp. enrichment culture]|uniref:nuclear transport factor 2 family protein n=1 Tax=Streptomyces sp. enrichment culture TaxID=1795815 RepID=UPI003F56EC13